MISSPRDVRGLGKRRFGRGEIRRVIVPVEDEVAGNIVKQLRGVFVQGRAGVGDGRQGLVIDLDRFRRILRLRQGFGDDQRHRLPDVAHLAGRQHGSRRIVARRTVAIGERHLAGDIAELVCFDVVTREHEQDARHATRGRRIDAADVGVRDPRSQHDGLRRIGKLDVIGIATATGDQGLVFETSNGLAYAEFHGSCLKWVLRT